MRKSCSEPLYLFDGSNPHLQGEKGISLSGKKKSPMFSKKTPTFLEKSPTFSENLPRFLEKVQRFCW